MLTRRSLLGLTSTALIAGFAGFGFGSSRMAISSAGQRVSTGSQLFKSSVGELEYAVAGLGRPFMMIHGAGGGFDQGLLAAQGLIERGLQVVSPSRFGYLRSSFPDDPSPDRQADALAELLDHLKIEKLPVAGLSAGAMTAAAFALRHPARCAKLVLLVPAGNLTNRDPVEFTWMQQKIAGLVLGSDTGFWLLSSIGRGQMIKTLLATDPALLDNAGAEERRRADSILDGIMPISRKIKGLGNDAIWSGEPTTLAFEKIEIPTLIMSCDDDLFGTAATARLIADKVTGSRLKIFHEGGHVWLGHHDEISDSIAGFVAA
jgi:2-hydroxy-6-oxonona-2,4-dienedioate hydrolase